MIDEYDDGFSLHGQVSTCAVVCEMCTINKARISNFQACSSHFNYDCCNWTDEGGLG